jgi:nicotinate dehydrogenase subunit B
VIVDGAAVRSCVTPVRSENEAITTIEGFQTDGSVMQGVSRALLEEVKFDATVVKSDNWATYPVPTFREIPEVEAVLINRPELPPAGGAEPAIIVIPAAIDNAIFDAVGVRLRQVPFTSERVLAALKSKEPGGGRA